jgi:fructoselysine 6-kinase
MNPQLLAVGDNVVDCYPDLGVMFPGGNTVNVAVHARRVGASSAYLGAVGTDAAGAVVRGSLVAEGVDTSLTRVVEGTNAYAMVRVIEGNRVFEHGDVGVSRFRVTDTDLARAASADVVHTGECSMLEEDLPRLAEAARLLSFDFSERPWPYVEQYAPLVSVAVLSAASVDEDPVLLAQRVAALGPRVVAVTQGPGGATLLVDGHVSRAPAGSGPIVDTLGAGDAFIARFLVGLARNEDLEVLLPAATSYATESCAEHGAFGHQAQLPPAHAPTPGLAAAP